MYTKLYSYTINNTLNRKGAPRRLFYKRELSANFFLLLHASFLKENACILLCLLPFLVQIEL